MKNWAIQRKKKSEELSYLRGNISSYFKQTSPKIPKRQQNNTQIIHKITLLWFLHLNLYHRCLFPWSPTAIVRHFVYRPLFLRPQSPCHRHRHCFGFSLTTTLPLLPNHHDLASFSPPLSCLLFPWLFFSYTQAQQPATSFAFASEDKQGHGPSHQYVPIVVSMMFARLNGEFYSKSYQYFSSSHGRNCPRITISP